MTELLWDFAGANHGLQWALLRQLHVIAGEQPHAHCSCGAPPWQAQNSPNPPSHNIFDTLHASAAQHAQPMRQPARAQADSLA